MASPVLQREQMSRVLVIDDDHLVLELVSHVLSRAGFSVVTAVNGRGGLEACRFCRPDLVVTDLMMPEMDGIAFIIAAKHEFPALPIIAMSGSIPGPIDRLEVATSVGACAVLAKPFGLNELLNAVHTACATAVHESATPTGTRF